jgi:hypothetical protein
MVPQSDLDWLTWPADQLLRISGVVAGWFFGKDAISFTIVQMGFATLVLAAVVALIVFWQVLVGYIAGRFGKINAADRAIIRCTTCRQSKR